MRKIGTERFNKRRLNAQCQRRPAVAARRRSIDGMLDSMPKRHRNFAVEVESVQRVGRAFAARSFDRDDAVHVFLALRLRR